MHGLPFGRRIAASLLSTAGSLKKVPATGGPAETITASSADYGGTWNRDGVILFSTGPGSPILRVPSAGGSATPVTSLDASQQALGHGWPYFLPDGKHFLYTIIASNSENSGIYVGSLDSKDTKLILKAHSSALYAPPGYLLFNRVGTLLAQPFDADRLELKGDAIPIAEGVQFNAANGQGGRRRLRERRAGLPIGTDSRTEQASVGGPKRDGATTGRSAPRLSKPTALSRWPARGRYD